MRLIVAVGRREWEKARDVDRWFISLLRLDAEHHLVQTIELAEPIMGRGSERIRPLRLRLAGAWRVGIIRMVKKAAARSLSRTIAQAA